MSFEDIEGMLFNISNMGNFSRMNSFLTLHKIVRAVGPKFVGVAGNLDYNCFYQGFGFFLGLELI